MKNAKKKYVRSMVLLYVLTATGCQPEEKQPESHIRILQKFEVAETHEIVNRFRTAIKDPEQYMTSSGIYIPAAQQEIRHLYPEEGSEEYRNIVRELYRRIVYFDSLPTSHPATPLFPTENLEAMDAFFTRAVPLAIVHLLDVLEGSGRQPQISPGAIIETDQAITALFDDRAILKERLKWLLYPLRDNHKVVFRIINVDKNNEKVFFGINLEGLQYRAFVDSEKVPELIGIQYGHTAAFIEKATPAVAGFDNEHLFYIVLHELLHTIIFADDGTNHGEDKEEQGLIATINRYETDNLIPSETLNADNYAVLIYIALRNLHNEGILDLTQY